MYMYSSIFIHIPSASIATPDTFIKQTNEGLFVTQYLMIFTQVMSDQYRKSPSSYPEIKLPWWNCWKGSIKKKAFENLIIKK